MPTAADVRLLELAFKLRLFILETNRPPPTPPDGRRKARLPSLSPAARKGCLGRGTKTLRHPFAQKRSVGTDHEVWWSRYRAVMRPPMR